MAWLERLDAGEVEVISRPRITVPLPDTDPADMKRHPLSLPFSLGGEGRVRGCYGDFSAINQRWNQGRSDASSLPSAENDGQVIQA